MKLLIPALLCLTLSLQAQNFRVDPVFNPTDAGFGIGEGPQERVTSVLRKPDGTIIVGGGFRYYDGKTRELIAMVNANGELLPTAATSGFRGFTVTTMALQADGKVIVGGEFTEYNNTVQNNITRLNADGSRDAAFNVGTGTNSQVRKIIVLNTGKILVAGSFTTYNGTAANRIVRLNADGSIDNTFSSGTGPNGGIFDIALQGSKIIIGGNFTSVAGNTARSFARLNENGSFDNTFNPGGVGFAGGSQVLVFTVAVRDDGRIYAGGQFTSYNGQSEINIAGIKADGTLNNDFWVENGTDGTISKIIIDDELNMLVAGAFTEFDGLERSGLVRVDIHGDLDEGTFNDGAGVAGVSDIFLTGYGGDILIGGDFASYNGQAVRNIARISHDGELKTDFNKPMKGADGIIYTMAEQHDGKILLGGSFRIFNGELKPYLVRTTANGAIDPTFQVGVGPDASVRSITVLPNHKILVYGFFSKYNGASVASLIRLNENGTLDATFNAGTSVGFGVANVMAIQADGKILLGGNFEQFNSIPHNRIVRLLENGAIDVTFNVGTGPDNYIDDIHVLSDGKILVTGSFNNFNGVARRSIARLLSTGTHDPSFEPEITSQVYIKHVVEQTDGKLLINGIFEPDAGNFWKVKRLLSNGKFDSSFDNNSKGAGGYIDALAVLPNGKILIAGSFLHVNNIFKKGMAQLNADGTLDTSFECEEGTNGRPVWGGLLLSSNNSVLIAGDFYQYNNEGRNRVARLLRKQATAFTINGPETGVYKQKLTYTVTSDRQGDITWTLDQSFDGTTGKAEFNQATKELTLGDVGKVRLTALLPSTAEIDAGRDEVVITISKAPVTINIDNLTKKFSPTPFDLGVTTTPSTIVNVNIDHTVSNTGSINLSGQRVTMQQVGTVAFKASVFGTNNTLPAEKSFLLTIAKGDQEITFAAIADMLNSNPAFQLTATSSSNLPVTFTASGPATISGNTVTLTRALGTVTIEATQAGNNNYNAAPPVQRSFKVEQDIVLGLDDVAAALDVWPVPASDILTITSPKTIERVMLLDAAGRAVAEASPFRLEHQVDVRSFVPGFYLLRVKTDEGVVSRKIMLHRAR